MSDKTKLVPGSDLMLFIGTGSTKTPIAFAKSVTLDYTNETIDVSSKDSGFFNEVMKVGSSWTVSTDGLFSFTGSTTGNTGVEQTFNIATSKGAEVNILVGVAEGTTPNWTESATAKAFTGTGIIANVNVSGEHKGITTWSISITGSGALTLV